MSESTDFADNLLGSMRCCLILPSLLKNNIPEKLFESPKTVEELSEGTQINPKRLHRFLRHLENHEIFSFDELTNKWSNTTKSSYFLNNFTKTLLIYETYSKTLEPWLYTEEVLYSEKNIFEILGQEPGYVQMQKSPEWLNLFQKHMKNITARNFSQVIESIDLTSVNKLLDVGGGDGSLAIALAKANENVSFAVYELERVKEKAEKNIEENGLADRISAIAGNFLESIPEGFDSISMKHVIHLSNDDSAALLLKNCRKALNPGNKLFIVDMVIDRNSPAYKYQVQMDLKMLYGFNAKERTLPDFEKLLTEAGFLIQKAVSVPYENVIEAIAV